MKPILITTMFKNGYYLILPRQKCLLIQKRKAKGYFEAGIRKPSRCEYFVSFGKVIFYFRIQERTLSWEDIPADRIIIGSKNA